MFNKIKRYNDIIKSTQKSKYKNNITLFDLDQIQLLNNKKLSHKEISDKLKINLDKIQYVLEMKYTKNKKCTKS